MSHVTKLEPFPQSKGTNVPSFQGHVDWYFFRQSGHTLAVYTPALYPVLNEHLFRLINGHFQLLNMLHALGRYTRYPQQVPHSS